MVVLPTFPPAGHMTGEDATPLDAGGSGVGSIGGANVGFWVTGATEVELEFAQPAARGERLFPSQ